MTKVISFQDKTVSNETVTVHVQLWIQPTEEDVDVKGYIEIESVSIVGYDKRCGYGLGRYEEKNFESCAEALGYSPYQLTEKILDKLNDR